MMIRKEMCTINTGTENEGQELFLKATTSMCVYQRLNKRVIMIIYYT